MIRGVHVKHAAGCGWRCAVFTLMIMVQDLMFHAGKAEPRKAFPFTRGSRGNKGWPKVTELTNVRATLNLGVLIPDTSQGIPHSLAHTELQIMIE